MVAKLCKQQASRKSSRVIIHEKAYKALKTTIANGTTVIGTIGSSSSHHITFSCNRVDDVVFYDHWLHRGHMSDFLSCMQYHNFRASHHNKNIGFLHLPRQQAFKVIILVAENVQFLFLIYINNGQFPSYLALDYNCRRWLSGIYGNLPE